MKKVKFKLSNLLLPLIAVIALFVSACGKDTITINDGPASLLEKVNDVENQKGVMHYDDAIKKWYVCSLNSDGKEDIRYNVWSEFDLTFQKENLNIYFSGDIYQWKKGYENPPITDNLIIYLSKIEVEQSK